MRYLKLRTLIIALMLSHSLVWGQKNRLRDMNSNVYAKDLIVDAANFSNERNISCWWCPDFNIPKRNLGISHRPSLDFNVYLFFEKSINDSLNSGIEISLNDWGIVNVKGALLLGRKSR